MTGETIVAATKIAIAILEQGPQSTRKTRLSRHEKDPRVLGGVEENSFPDPAAAASLLSKRYRDISHLQADNMIGAVETMVQPVPNLLGTQGEAVEDMMMVMIIMMATTTDRDVVASVGVVRPYKIVC